MTLNRETFIGRREILNFQFHETIRFENSTLSDLKIKSPSFARSHRLVNFFPAFNLSLSLSLSPSRETGSEISRTVV